MTRVLTTVAALLACALPALHADVLVVQQNGPAGTFPHPQAAIDAAGEGDTILVRGAGTTLFDQGVVITGKSLQLLVEDGVQPFARQLRVTGLAAGQTVVVRGMDFGTNVSAFPLGVGVLISDCAGSVRLEEVSAKGLDGLPSSFMFPSSDGAAGLLVVDADDVSARDCSFEGGRGGNLDDEDFEFAPTDGGPGVLVRSSLLSLQGCTLVGGHGGSVFDTTPVSAGRGGDGLLNKTGKVFVAGGTSTGGAGGLGDCDFFSCGPGGGGGDGARLEQASAWVGLRDVELAGGPGGAALGGPSLDGADGDPLDPGAGASTSFVEPARSFSMSSPASDDAVVRAHFAGSPGDVVLAWAGFSSLQKLFFGFEGPLLVGPPFATAQPLVLGVADAKGELTVVLPLVELPAGLADLTVPVQGLAQATSGALSLAPASVTTVIDGDL